GAAGRGALPPRAGRGRHADPRRGPAPDTAGWAVPSSLPPTPTVRAGPRPEGAPVPAGPPLRFRPSPAVGRSRSPGRARARRRQVLAWAVVALVAVIVARTASAARADAARWQGDVA